MTTEFADNFFKCCKKTEFIAALTAIGVGYIGGSGLVNRYLKPVTVEVETEIGDAPKSSLNLWNLLKLSPTIVDGFVIIVTQGSTLILTVLSWTLLRRFQAFITQVREGQINATNLDGEFRRLENDVRDIRDSNIERENEVETQRMTKENNEILRQQGNEFSKRLKEIKQQLDLYFKGDIDEKKKMNENFDRLQREFYLFRDGGETFQVPIFNRGRNKIGTATQLQEQITQNINRGDIISDPQPVNKPEVKLQDELKKIWKEAAKIGEISLEQSTELDNIAKRIISTDLINKRQELLDRISKDSAIRIQIIKDIYYIIKYQATQGNRITLTITLDNLPYIELVKFRERLYRNIIITIYKKWMREGRTELILQLHRNEVNTINTESFYEIMDKIDFNNVKNMDDLKEKEDLIFLLNQIADMERDLRRRYNEFAFVPELRNAFTNIEVVLSEIFKYIEVTQSWHLTRSQTIYDVYMALVELYSKVVRREGFELTPNAGFEIKEL